MFCARFSFCIKLNPLLLAAAAAAAAGSVAVPLGIDSSLCGMAPIQAACTPHTVDAYIRACMHLARVYRELFLFSLLSPHSSKNLTLFFVLSLFYYIQIRLSRFVVLYVYCALSLLLL